jgi:hypothetical protein
MSYCRWSSDNGYCDLYVYEDVHGGWTTHVATHRIPPGAPPDPIDLLFAGDVGGYLKRNEERSEWIKGINTIKIDHPEAGTSFNHDTPGECAENLKRLRAEGFVVPECAINSLMEEEAEREASAGDIEGQGGSSPV